MSRTYKDKNFYLRFPEEEYHYGTEYVDYDYEAKSIWGGMRTFTGRRYFDVAGAKTKKPRHYEGDWKWYKNTPSWFVRDFMTGPKRRACRDWEKKVVLAEDLEDFEDCPDFGKKPHIYYW